MHIECPSCSTENEIEYGEKIVCGECKESFSGHTYKRFKKPIISATTALIIGSYGTYKIDKLLIEESRYPVNIEYELIDSCVNSSRSSLSYARYTEKKSICSCALEKTMERIKYRKFEESEKEFLSRFRESIAICK